MIVFELQLKEEEERSWQISRHAPKPWKEYSSVDFGKSYQKNKISKGDKSKQLHAQRKVAEQLLSSWNWALVTSTNSFYPLPVFFYLYVYLLVLHQHLNARSAWFLLDLMPDKRAGSWRAMWPGRDVAYAISVFSTQFSVTFTFLFPNIRGCFLKKKRELATQFSFLCMWTTVSGSNSLSFAIIGDQGLEIWQRALRMTGDTDTAKSSTLFFPSSFFFACFLIFLKKAFSER